MRVASIVVQSASKDALYNMVGNTSANFRRQVNKVVTLFWPENWGKHNLDSAWTNHNNLILLTKLAVSD